MEDRRTGPADRRRSNWHEAVERLNPPDPPAITVRATREGLVGGHTASGYIVDTIVPFIALPARRALHRHVLLRNPANGRTCYAVVLDVGPWNTDDDAYVFRGARPKAERGESVSGRGTNGAGIDLSERVWLQLGMAGNTDVEWIFLA